LALILAAVPAFCGEYVVFSSGLKLRADRHEQFGGTIRLFHNGGVTEVPATLVSGFEQEEVVKPPSVEAVIAPAVAKPETAASQDPKGALGVMQLMPGTAKTLGADPHDTAQNIDAGTRLLRELLLKYDGDVVKALAAYNAGEGAVDKYQGVPPYNETRWYVKKVVDAYQKAGGQ
jgi:hypothetical protein